MTPPAIRKQQERQRRKEAGERLFQAWVPADKMDACKTAVAEILTKDANA
jgi:hypothetical protein